MGNLLLSCFSAPSQWENSTFLDVLHLSNGKPPPSSPSCPLPTSDPSIGSLLMLLPPPRSPRPSRPPTAPRPARAGAPVPSSADLLHAPLATSVASSMEPGPAWSNPGAAAWPQPPAPSPSMGPPAPPWPMGSMWWPPCVTLEAPHGSGSWLRLERTQWAHRWLLFTSSALGPSSPSRGRRRSG